jgi:hypothetical protein
MKTPGNGLSFLSTCQEKDIPSERSNINNILYVTVDKCAPTWRAIRDVLYPVASALFGGIALASALPPHDMEGLAFVAFAPLLAASCRCKPLYAVGLGLMTGITGGIDPGSNVLYVISNARRAIRPLDTLFIRYCSSNRIRHDFASSGD